jgi:hypothetical protein
LFDSVGKLAACASLVAIAAKRFREQASEARNLHGAKIAGKHTTSSLAGSGTQEGASNTTQINAARAAKVLPPTVSSRKHALTSAAEHYNAIDLSWSALTSFARNCFSLPHRNTLKEPAAVVTSASTSICEGQNGSAKILHAAKRFNVKHKARARQP